MGYLSNSKHVIDSILTKKGREALAKNDGSFKITQFALSDDEIDYTLYNPNHPSGSAYFGEAIQYMPLLEAFPDETQIMKYKLVTLPRGTAKMPVLDIGYTSITIKQGSVLTISPQTLNYIGGNTHESSGYTFTISDSRLFTTFNGSGVLQAKTTSDKGQSSLSTLGTNVSKTVVGNVLNIKATTINALFGSNPALYATLIVTGRDSGARLSIPVKITKPQLFATSTLNAQ